MKFIISIALMLQLVTSVAIGQSWQWSKGSGGPSEDEACSIATDKAGNVYAAGYFKSSSMTFGTITLANPNGATWEAFLVKYDKSGNVLWAKSAGGTNFDKINSVTTDLFGNVIIVGYFFSTSITFGTITLQNLDPAGGTSDIFIAKLDSNGNTLWAKSTGGQFASYAVHNDFANAVTTDYGGNIYVTGGYYDSVYFGLQTLFNSHSGSSDMFLVKYNAAGTAQWARTAGSIGDDNPNSLCSDNSGNIYVAGSFEGPTIQFGTSVLSSLGYTDIFLAKYDGNGTVLWTTRSGSSGSDEATAVATDASNNVYVGGNFASPSIAFGSTTINNHGLNKDIFLAKFNSAGNLKWAKDIGGNNMEKLSSIVTDHAKNVYIAGSFSSPSITFGVSTLTTYLDFKLFVAKYDSTGVAAWGKSAKGTTSEAFAIAMDTASNIYVAGDYAGWSDTFDTHLLTGAGQEDVFVAKLSSKQSVYVSDLQVGSSNLQFYPNPTSGKIIIVVPEDTDFSTIIISDYLGRQVFDLPISPSEKTIQINLDNITDGMYFLHAYGENSSGYFPFVIRR